MPAMTVVRRMLMPEQSIHCRFVYSGHGHPAPWPRHGHPLLSLRYYPKRVPCSGRLGPTWAQTLIEPRGLSSGTTYSIVFFCVGHVASPVRGPARLPPPLISAKGGAMLENATLEFE